MGNDTGIDADQILIWSVRNHANDAGVAAFLSVLSEDELRRAERYRFERLRRSFVIAHGILRVLLGRLSDTEPQKLQFSRDPRGKPVLARASWLQFNLSHSGDLILIAAAKGIALGVDVEEMRALKNLESVAAGIMCCEERAQLDARSPEYAVAFYRAWTRKEAFVKATGDGLRTSLSEIHIQEEVDGRPCAISVGGNKARAAGWNLHDLDVGPCYAGALAYRGPRRRITISDGA